jgi:hypothetical protein
LADDAPTATLPAIPTDKIAEALLHLRRPFAPSAVKWKIQASDFYDGKKGGSKKDATWVLVVPYVDARLVSARLNAVVAGGWEEAPVERVGENLLRYKLTVLGQTHTDVGEGQGRGAGMKVKATDSDALKRVAVRFGVGEYLYAMPAFNFYVTPKGDMQEDKPTVKRMESGKPGYLKGQHETWLRQAYEQWLEEEGTEKFGQMLDHGDAAKGSIGQLLDQGGTPDEGEVSDEDLRPAPLDDDEAKQLRERIASTFTELGQINPDRLTQGRLEKMVEEAAHSHPELERVATTIENLRDTEVTLGRLRDQLIEKVGAKKAKPLIDSAERRGSQEERIAAMEKAIGEAENAAG